MKSHQSQEDYLETILMLSETHDEVHAIDIANKLNYSKASVSVAMKKLRNLNEINVSNNGTITLTDKGLDIAQAIYSRHKTLSWFFTKLGVNPEIAAKDACEMEHDLSDETFNALLAHIERHKKLEENNKDALGEI